MWVARNKDKSLRLFYNKPYKSSNEWKSKYEGESEFYLTEEDFSELKWEDEPIEVDIVRKEFKYCAKDTALHFYLNKELYNNENYRKVIRNRVLYRNVIINFEYELDGKTNIGTAYSNSLATLENVFKELERCFYVDSKR